MTMWKFLLFLVLSVTISFVNGGFGDNMLGPGKWTVLNLMKCEDHDQYEMLFEISRQKLNRTHDCFSAHINSDRVIDASYSVEVIAYQQVDGGFKFYTKIDDECACTFIQKYTGDNMRRAFDMAGLDPPDCPIPAGDYTIDEFVFDYQDLPEKGIYGTYDVNLYLLYLGERVCCIRIMVNFDETASDEDCDD